MKRYFVTFSVALVLLAAIYSDFNKKIWNHPGRVIEWDVISYYGYLPATFIYQDITLRFIDNYQGEKHFVLWAKKLPNGNRVLKMTMGVSIMVSPFFFVANALAGPLGYDTGGYSSPYRFAIVMAALFYLALSLIVLSRVLRFYFSKWISGIVILAIGLGTNLFWYSTFEPGMSHVYSFFLASVFILLTIKWYQNSTGWYSVLLGLVAGLLTLIRPTNVLMVLFFILYDIKNRDDIKGRFVFFRKHYLQLAAILFFGFLVLLPQLIYWKTISGHWLYYSYGNEGFFFLHPQLINILFSFRKGWFVYTPVMVFGVLGIYFLLKKFKPLFLPVSVILIAVLYVDSSWWCWWYGGGLSQRELIDIYPFMALPLAAFLQWIGKQRLLLRYFIGILFTVSVLLGIFYNVQYRYGSIHWDAMSKQAYFNSFGRVYPSSKFNQLLVHPDYKRAILGLPEKHPGQVKAETIESIIQRKKKDSKWLDEVMQKAKKRNIPLDSMLRLEAKYILKHSK